MEGHDSGTLGVRNAHAMAYDAVSRRVVLTGGADASSVRGDTWAWDGARWTLVTTTGPSPRTFPAMTFDEARGEVALFGGNRVLFGTADDWNTLLGDTWTLRGDTWHRQNVTGPGARAEAAMAYDPARERVVLFGGYRRTPDERIRLGDTWEWDGRQWTQVATEGPAPRNGATMAFDETTGTVILSGGPPAFVTPETWEWNGTSWRQVPPPDPPARFNPTMAYLPDLRMLMRFGGWTGSERAGDTWIRTNGHWAEVDAQGPSARNHSAMAYDAGRKRVVLFGGHDGELVFGDTWEFDGTAWRQITRVPPIPRVDNGHD